MNGIGATVTGRTVCPICKTDKSWVLSVDRGNLSEESMDAEIEKCIELQNREVVDPNHQDHIEALEKTVEVVKL